MNDYISKVDVLEIYADLYQVFDDNPYIRNELSEVYDKINDLKGQETCWISVEDEMPEPYKNVLVVNRSGVTIAWYNGRYWERGANTNHRSLKTVTHWMPLPDQPRERR